MSDEQKEQHNYNKNDNKQINQNPSLIELWIISLLKLLQQPYAMLIMILSIGIISWILGSLGDKETFGGLIPVIVLLICLSNFFTWTCLTLFPIFLLKKDLKEHKDSEKFKKTYQIIENAIFVLMSQLNFKLLKMVGMFASIVMIYHFFIKTNYQFSYLDFYNTPILIFLVYSITDIFISIKNSHLKTEFLAFLMLKDKISTKNVEFKGQKGVSLNKKEIKKVSQAFERFLDKNKTTLYLNALMLLSVFGLTVYFSIFQESEQLQNQNNNLKDFFILSIMSIFLFIYNILFNITLFEFFEEENKEGYKEKNIDEDIIDLSEERNSAVMTKNES